MRIRGLIKNWNWRSGWAQRRTGRRSSSAQPPAFSRTANAVQHDSRALKYEQAMNALATRYPKDVEVQVFYALALLSNADPSDKTHARQKQAAQMLEPIFRSSPDHPGVAHYLIHAYDNAELAPQGLPAARLYSKIAPSA